MSSVRFIGVVALLLLTWAPPVQAVERAPIVAFVGVYDSTGQQDVSRRVESVFVRLMKDVTVFKVKLPSELEAQGFGYEERQRLLASPAPEHQLEPYRKLLGEYVMLVVTAPDAGSRKGVDVWLRVLSTADGSEFYRDHAEGLSETSIKQIILDLSDILERVNEAPPGVGTAIPAPRERSRSFAKPMPLPRKVGWVATGVGLAVLAVGIGLGAASRSLQSHVRETYQSGATARQQVDKSNAEAVGANISFAASALIGGAGIGLVVAF